MVSKKPCTLTLLDQLASVLVLEGHDSPVIFPALIQALMVLASTAEASRDASIPCQQPRPFGVPVSVDKDVHIPFTNGSYTFASMYHRQGGVPGTFANRDFPPSLLHLHPQFAPPNLDCTPISMLNHSGVGAFRPFASTEDRESYQSAFTPAKRLKNCHDTESPHLRFSDADGKEYDFGTQLPSSSPGSLKVDDTGKKIFAVSGLISDREASSSPEDRNDRCHLVGTVRSLATDPRATAAEAQLENALRNVVDLAVALRDLEVEGEPPLPARGQGPRAGCVPSPALQVPTLPSRTKNAASPCSGNGRHGGTGEGV
ncbi:E3 ubiquitin-protein ligase RNF220 [Fukomys damarensis]|uniref:E3 ubiquitin-protein ligase RNF220 n=1 Tax=Fukomys damarensis TaxID=885580 RepID=A0A091CPB0_FUKDA|nr:E3 ubiquitin-protein ligase RNF220 [Fukomys damarensis]